jgi:hypothetical protein
MPRNRLRHGAAARVTGTDKENCFHSSDYLGPEMIPHEQTQTAGGLAMLVRMVLNELLPKVYPSRSQTVGIHIHGRGGRPAT